MIAGECGSSGFIDGPLGYNRLSYPRNLGVSREGTLFFFDSGNEYIRMVSKGVVYTLLLGACREGKPGDIKWKKQEKYQVTFSGVCFATKIGLRGLQVLRGTPSIPAFWTSAACIPRSAPTAQQCLLIIDFLLQIVVILDEELPQLWSCCLFAPVRPRLKGHLLSAYLLCRISRIKEFNPSHSSLV